jgi:hypothetical protein
MEIRIRATGAVMYESEFRRWLLETNGPSYDALTPEIMELLGVDPVFEGPQPIPTTPYQFSYRYGVQQIDGKWYTHYALGPVFSDTEEATAEEQEAAYKAQKDAEQWSAIRADRNKRLADCDWTQLADAGVDAAAWAAYRRELRNMPQTYSNPFDIVWPTPPSM